MIKSAKLAFVSIVAVASVAGVAGVAGAGEPAKPAPKDAPAMEVPRPAPQIAARVKAMAGTWRCTGTAPGMDGKDQKFTGTMASKADLDGFWVRDSFSGVLGAGKTAMKFKFESFATFDPNAKKWRSVMVDNWGGQMIGSGDEMKDGKMDTLSESMDMMGKGQAKDHTDVSDAKKGAHMWGEMSRDGKTWQKSYDMICKK